MGGNIYLFLKAWVLNLPQPEGFVPSCQKTGLITRFGWSKGKALFSPPFDYVTLQMGEL